MNDELVTVIARSDHSQIISDVAISAADFRKRILIFNSLRLTADIQPCDTKCKRSRLPRFARNDGLWIPAFAGMERK